MKYRLLIFSLLFSLTLSAQNFNGGWRFIKADNPAFAEALFDDSSWRLLDLPHDWGVEGEFKQEYPGETGKLPWWGTAWYRKHFTVNDLSESVFIDFGGVMANPTVFCNGVEVGRWAYGYSSFRVDLTPSLREGDNVVAVRVDNPENSSRWYPGGGIYRNVSLVREGPVAVDHWGTFVRTELVGEGAKVSLSVSIRGGFEGVNIRSRIFREGSTESIAEAVSEAGEATVNQCFELKDISLWSPEHPSMYVVRTELLKEGKVAAEYDTPFGIRSASFRPDGFYLNGEKTFIKGVCLHHDAGALGAAWNEEVWVKRLKALKEMGCNAIRTSHNPPAQELLDLCDHMGFLVMDELTDTWTYAKKPNGYASLFEEWAEKDLRAMIRRDRNHPSVILWSIGNECGEQGLPEKWWIPHHLTYICHQEDPTRPTTSGNDNLWASTQPYHESVDVYGFNYKPHSYSAFHKANPTQPYLGSETASCISTRGYYEFPVSNEKGEGWTMDPPFHVSSYDLYAPAWASSPDYEWFYEDENPECAGEFVWTGYDYLGEPTPYNLDPSILTNFHSEEEKAKAIAELESWGQKVATVPLPSRSSYFGIFDLAGFPKDRFWLYQARWRPSLPMAHILPHWTWPGREGKVTPIHVYTSGDSAELFINGESKGLKVKGDREYRLRWDDVLYEPGTVEVVAYKDGMEWARDAVRTAGKPYRIEVTKDAGGSDSDSYAFYTVRVLDRHGNLVPAAENLLEISVKDASFVAADAGDPTSLVPFYSKSLKAFGGLASIIIKPSSSKDGILTVKSKGLKTGKTIVPKR